MNVSLTPELEKLIADKVKSGRYNTASEVVRESLRLLEREDELRRLKYEELRREVLKGVEQIGRGEYTEVSSKEEWVAFLDGVKEKGRKRLAEARGKSK